MSSIKDNESEAEAFAKVKLVELRALIHRQLDYIARYAYFRFRSLLESNIALNVSTEIEPGEREMKLIIKVTIPDEIVENLKKYWSAVRKLTYSARRNEQYKYKFKDIDNMIEGEKHDLSHNQDRSSRAKEDRGQTRRGSEKE